MKKPVVFIIFNRPEMAKTVFEQIRRYEPTRLFVIADGPRTYKAEEKTLCHEAREVIKVDWNCEVTTIYSEINLGCQQRIYTGLNEVFEHVEEAIILEDDCVPHIDFFSFCEEMLNYYDNNEKIMSITGSNYLPKELQDSITESYYFSKSPDSCGWATWKRAWSKIDIRMSKWSEYRVSEQFNQFCYDVYFREYWIDQFDKVITKTVDSWFYPWMLTCWLGKVYRLFLKQI